MRPSEFSSTLQPQAWSSLSDIDKGTKTALAEQPVTGHPALSRSLIGVLRALIGTTSEQNQNQSGTNPESTLKRPAKQEKGGPTLLFAPDVGGPEM